MFSVITVKNLEKLFNVLIIQANAEVIDRFFEFGVTEGLAAVVVKNLEKTAKTHNSTAATRLYLVSENLEKLCITSVHRRKCVV